MLVQYCTNMAVLLGMVPVARNEHDDNDNCCLCLSSFNVDWLWRFLCLSL